MQKRKAEDLKDLEELMTENFLACIDQFAFGSCGSDNDPDL